MNLYDLHKKPQTLKGHHEKDDLIPELAWEQVQRNQKATSQQEYAISKNAQYSYRYALEILHKPFAKGEDAISKEASWAYYYTLRVLKHAWPKGEDTIAKDPVFAFYYALYTLKKPWKKGEDAIAKGDPFFKNWYKKQFGIKL